MKIAHLSDIHFFKNKFSLGTFFSKQLLGILNYYFNRKASSIDFDPYALPKFLKVQGVTHVVISGDLTTTSSKEEFELAASFIRQLKDQGFKTFVIPGNHDFYTWRSQKSQRFYDFIPSSPGLKEEGLSYEDFGEGYKCISLNTALATPYWSSEGLFSTKLEKRLQNLLNTIPKEQPLIVLNHFPVFEGKRPKRHQMRRLEALRSILENHSNIKLYLHGHTHKSEFTTSGPLMINSGSLTLTKGGSFHIMDLTSESLEVQVYTHENKAWMVKTKKNFPLTKMTKRVVKLKF